jgi:hypothetical protein
MTLKLKFLENLASNKFGIAFQALEKIEDCDRLEGCFSIVCCETETCDSFRPNVFENPYLRKCLA